MNDFLEILLRCDWSALAYPAGSSLAKYPTSLTAGIYDPEMGFRGRLDSSNREAWMSALGHKRTCTVQKGMSALPPKADMCSAAWDVGFGPKADTRIYNHSANPALLRPSAYLAKSSGLRSGVTFLRFEAHNDGSILRKRAIAILARSIRPKKALLAAATRAEPAKLGCSRSAFSA